MKAKVKIPFYATETGAVKRNEIIEVSTKMASGLIKAGYIEEIKEPAKPAAKEKKTKA